jgi:hypothetical protein
VSHDTYVQWWLERLKPGTLLYLKSAPELGFWMVYHCVLDEFPGMWWQLKADLIDPRCTLSRIEIEHSTFLDRWHVVEAT